MKPLFQSVRFAGTSFHAKTRPEFLINRPIYIGSCPKNPHSIGNRRLFDDGMGIFRVKR
nr:MAG TPA: hypothetical protein [Caudoviricetes sp.]